MLSPDFNYKQYQKEFTQSFLFPNSLYQTSLHNEHFALVILSQCLCTEYSYFILTQSEKFLGDICNNDDHTGCDKIRSKLGK